MKKDSQNQSERPEEETDFTAPENTAEQNETIAEDANEEAAEETDTTVAELAEMKDKYLRLYSEFDNFRRRTAKEKIESFKTANQDLMLALLPVVDDLERARQSLDKAPDLESVKQGVDLVFSKFANVLKQKGLQPMEAIGEEFNVEKHEAITQIPAPTADMKGKVVDEVEKGYFLNDKVIRFAKVVIGS